MAQISVLEVGFWILDSKFNSANPPVNAVNRTLLMRDVGFVPVIVCNVASTSLSLSALLLSSIVVSVPLPLLYTLVKGQRSTEANCCCASWDQTDDGRAESATATHRFHALRTRYAPKRVRNSKKEVFVKILVGWTDRTIAFVHTTEKLTGGECNSG